ncbi:CDP-glycerol glycerophosphotransferase family protein [Amnibacterium kyonggiense]|uniref:CDP-glycerol:poly(Glycerophosphate) glycerophosphotransferase n=1 Tax=Amnibacterium kyonggiense TaxID=595671 RepID=A0A4R7FH38_9MICO|nr:CDP-glycerol glycerophosphotransferase family protein [Amnibacterium kyonggiense]TDS74980.1 CDP-glycerol:poly(glycerophosphate) glycerophosphotransferase [Amnibacterium kyonggiense]
MRRPRGLAAVRFGQDSSDVVDLGLVGLAVLAAVVALLLGQWGVAVVGAAPSLIADVVRGERPPRLRRLLRRVLLDRPERSLVRNGAVAVAVAATPPETEFASLAFLLVTVMVAHLGLTGYTALGVRRLARERATMTWRHLDVPSTGSGHRAGESEGPGPLPDPVQDRLPIDGLRLLTASEVLVLGGFAFAAAGVRVVPLVLAVLVLAIILWTCWTAWRAWGPHAGHPVRDSDDAVAAAVADLAPEVVFYFSSPADGTYALGVWASVINALERPALVVLREAVHLTGTESILKPTVVAPTVTDLIAITPGSVRIVLYPTNVVRNDEMIRIPGPMHCFIGHGDSDKVGSFSPLNRMYDEIWVAGRAAIDRYAAVDEGIDLNVLRAVGRPQLADIARATPETEPGHRLTVLYAPTWEGFFDEADYSSVAAMGERIVRGCLDAGADVLFKPHPLTGHRLPEAGRAREAIDELVRRAGGGSEIVAPSPNSLYEAFNRADLLISDISSVITDFLASRKPYAVSNRRDVPEAEFRAMFPSSSAAELLGSDLATLPTALADAAGADPRRAQRETLAEYLLGPEGDPMVVFLAEIDAFIARADARLARTGGA